MRTIPLTIVIEDDISLEIAKKVILSTNNHYEITRILPDNSRQKSSPGSGYIYKKINAFNNAARHGHYLILTDLDQNECAPDFLATLIPGVRNSNLILRIAVREVESWLLADKANFSGYLGVSKDIIEDDPEKLWDPKKYIFTLAKRSRKRTIREGIPPADKTARTGVNYNPLLTVFVREHWDFKAAMNRSNSLRRFVQVFHNE